MKYTLSITEGSAVCLLNIHPHTPAVKNEYSNFFGFIEHLLCHQECCHCFYFSRICFSSSVLDRLNGLLEPNGVLSIDERGTVNGSIPSVKPHPNFR